MLAMVSASTLFAQSSGGPDAYGYTWKNNTDPTGPVYNWINLAAPGTHYAGTEITGLADDNATSFISMGFTMKHYWVDVNRIKVGSNGWISFSDISNIAHGFPNMPVADAFNNLLAPFMADLNFSKALGANPAKAYYWTNNVDSMIVSYENVPFWQDNTPDFIGSNSFQVIFTKADNGITFQYKNMETTIPNVTTFNDAVVGMENVTGALGFQIMVDQIPASNTAIKFYRPANSTFQVLDLKANWHNNERNGAYFGMKGQALPVLGNVANVGNTDFTANYSVRTIIRQTGVTAPKFNQLIALPKLRQGTDTTFTHTGTVTPTSEGSHTVTTSIVATGDANSANNSLITEFVVVDTTGRKREVSLMYNDGTPEGITGFGAAVYFRPPFFPTEVRSIEALLLSSTGATAADNGFNVRVYAEDPITGGLGAILFDSTLLAADITINAINSIEIPQRKLKMITSGGIYVAWVPVEAPGVSANTFVATDETAPFSLRTYEVQNGTISDFRTADTEDFIIGVSIGTKILSPDGVAKDKNSLFGFENLYPNPATSKVTFEYNLKQSAPVEITIANVIGSKVKTVTLGKKAAGAQKEVLNISDLKAGVYFCTMKVGETTVTKRMVVTK